MCSETVKNVLVNEFKLSNFGFHHDPVDAFVRSQWQSKPKNTNYLIYRWLVAVILVATVMISIYSNLQTNTFGTFFIYLTNWAILLNTIVGIYSAVLVTIWHIDTKFQGNSSLFCKMFDNTWLDLAIYRTETILNTKEMPTLFKIYWVLHNIVSAMAFVITIVYWSKLYDGEF